MPDNTVSQEISPAKEKTTSKSNSIKFEDGFSIAVFCGSSPGKNPAHKALAHALGTQMGAQGIRLIYGGGGLGLMGTVARSAHEAGGKVVGIMPEFLTQAEAIFKEVEHRIVPDMHTRKTQMYDESDAFIILPGGVGTLEEAVEILSWLRLSLHTKPVIFLSDTGYWDDLIKLFKQTISDGFTPETFNDHLHSVTTPQDAITLISTLSVAMKSDIKAPVKPKLSDL